MYAAAVMLDAVFELIVVAFKIACYVVAGIFWAMYATGWLCFYTIKYGIKFSIWLWKGGRHAWHSRFSSKGRGWAVLHHSDGGVPSR